MATFSDSGTPQSGSASPTVHVPAGESEAENAGTATKTTASKAKKQTDANGEPKPTKRRAPRACTSCRARKVRCDVVERHPCGNCVFDGVACTIQESRRRKKHFRTSNPDTSVGPISPGAKAALHDWRSGSHQINIASAGLRRPSSVSAASFSGVENSGSIPGGDGHVPHMLYQGYGQQAAGQASWSNSGKLSGSPQPALHPDPRDDPDPLTILPGFIRPPPGKIGRDEIQYLHRKGALSLPDAEFQEALLQAYVEFVHPYMPLLELHDFLNRLNARDGGLGKVSLLLYHAVMFAASAFVPAKFFIGAGYNDRKAARKAFFQKARLLYDFDYESDRLILVQALLLMTYWYETPDDQKDTWHWMGVAISLAHTIGLHRNPVNANMSPHKQKLWKRVWWSCFMRDRLIALGMRRPTRIKDEDFDVPMLQESDFEIGVLAGDNGILSTCRFMHDIAMQRELAQLCVQKAKLCVLISRMLKAQYSVLIADRAHPEATTNTTMMLLPNKAMDNQETVRKVDAELASWKAALPPSCKYRPLGEPDIESGRSTVAVQRNLLHMVYQTTISALHRPQFLPASPTQAAAVPRDLQVQSRERVKNAAAQITGMARDMHRWELEKYLPTTGVTVVLPAMIIHLLDMKDPDQQRRHAAKKGFAVCMKVMHKLREIYAAADFATGFLEAALKKAAVEYQMSQMALGNATMTLPEVSSSTFAQQPATPPPDPGNYPMPDLAGHAQNPSPVIPAPLVGRFAQAMQAMSGIEVNSPPQSAGEAVFTPETSVSAEVPPDMGNLDEMDWAAVEMPNLNFNEWLNFPAEGMSGVSNADNYNMGMFDVAMQ